jgi:hypothetical protein
MFAVILLAILIDQVTPSPGASPPAATAPAPLTVTPAAVNLNPAQERILNVSGATAPLTLTLDRRVVNVSASADGTTITVDATQQTGTDTLHVTDANGATAGVTIRVAFNAGTIVPQTTLNVTGNPAQPDWLADAISKWVARVSPVMPYANISASVTQPAAPLAPGASAQFPVAVQITSDGRYFDQIGTTTVTVQNTALPPFDPAVLMYDDDPEHVASDGLLFRGTVTAAQAARLYYYHDDTDDPRQLIVMLQNAGDAPASVQITDAMAGPNMDVMQVGQSLSKRFLLAKSAEESVVVDLPQNQPYLVTKLTMTSRQLIAGIADVRVLSGGPVQVTVLAVTPGVDPQMPLSGPLLPGDGHHRTGVFSLAGFGNDRLTYTVGADDATVVLGDTEPTPPNADASAIGHDYGDYGVVHAIDVSLNNPGSTPATVYLFMQPLAGPARGTFLVDGNSVDVGCVRVPSRYQVTAFDLTPGQSSRAVVQTMTDGGSFYPVRIGLSTTAPLPAAPPINAPDGCFPKAQPAATP